MSRADTLKKLIEEVPSVGDHYLQRYLLDNAPAIRDLIAAAEEVVKRSDQFVSDTGMKHGDPLTDAVDVCRKALANIKEQE